MTYVFFLIYFLRWQWISSISSIFCWLLWQGNTEQPRADAAARRKPKGQWQDGGACLWGFAGAGGASRSNVQAFMLLGTVSPWGLGRTECDSMACVLGRASGRQVSGAVSGEGSGASPSMPVVSGHGRLNLSLLHALCHLQKCGGGWSLCSKWLTLRKPQTDDTD